MAAYNEVGQGPFSSEVSFRIGAQLRPGRPSDSPPPDDGVVVLALAGAGRDGADAPTTYVIEAGSGRADRISPVSSSAAARPPAAVPAGVSTCGCAVNDLGPEDPSEELVLRNVAEVGAPTGLTETGGGTTVILNWQPPSTGVAPAGYIIEAGSAPGLANLAVLRVGAVTRLRSRCRRAPTSCGCAPWRPMARPGRVERIVINR